MLQNKIRERDDSYFYKITVSIIKFLNDDLKHSMTYLCWTSLLEIILALRMKPSYKEHFREYRINCEMKTPYVKMGYCYSGTESTRYWKHLLRYWPIFARSSTLHRAGAVSTRQKWLFISIIWSLLSFQIGPVEESGQ